MGNIYLLDNQIISYWAEPRGNLHSAVSAHLDGLPTTVRLAVSAIVLGEIEYGLNVACQKDTEKQAQLRAFLHQHFPYVVDVTNKTKAEYGQLKAKAFEKFCPNKKKKTLRFDQMTNPIDGSEIHLTENDIWIAAQALERNIILVSADKHMQRLQELDGQIRLEDWSRPAAPSCHTQA